MCLKSDVKSQKARAMLVPNATKTKTKKPVLGMFTPDHIVMPKAKTKTVVAKLSAREIIFLFLQSTG